MGSGTETPTTAPLTPVDAVLLALVPGLMALTLCFGAGVLLNLLWSTTAALLTEAIARLAERKSLRSPVSDRATLLVALLLAVSLPPACPWWLATAGAVVAVAVGRRLSNGNGGLLFNPTMLAYATLLLCFPKEISRWPGPEGTAAALSTGVADTIRASLDLLPSATLDGFTMATPLEVLRQDTSHTVAELRQLQPQFGAVAGRGWEWANAAFLAGGAWLAQRRTIDWRAPVGMLLGLGVVALLNDDGSSASGGPVLFHLFGGGTMLAAFFMLTEPGTSARGPRVRMLAGLVAGGLVYLMRSSGSWPDGIAFAVLALNAATPLAERVFATLFSTEKSTVGRGRADASTALSFARSAARACMILALLSLNWHGVAPVHASRQADTAGALLAELAEAGYTHQQSFSVQDPALLGLPAPRTAWRLDTASGSGAVVLPLRAHEGYGGPIDLLLAVDEGGRVLAVRVIAHSESPGFSDPLDAADHGWLRGFEGRSSAGSRWALRRDGGDFDAFTGATVTPRAIVAGIRNGLQYVEEHRPELLGATAPQDHGN